jgi:hypothetical protein
MMQYFHSNQPSTTTPSLVTCPRCPPANSAFTLHVLASSAKRAPLHQPNIIRNSSTRSPEPQIHKKQKRTLPNHHVRSNPPHHCPLPRAILPPNRPHPRQSPPAARRDSNHRRWWPDQCFFDTGMFIPDPPVWSRVLMDFVLMGIRVF